MTRGRAALTVGLVLLAVARPLHADDWTLVGNDHGISIYRRQVAGSDIVALRGEGAIEAPVWKVASVLLDTRRAPEWADSLKSSSVVRRLNPTTYVEYNHLALPLIIKDRDFVSEVHVEVNAADRSVALVYAPIDDPGAPVTQNVRGQILEGVFRARSIAAGQRTELTAELHADPKGALPAWVVNFFQKSWPRNTFEGIRTQVAKPDVTIPGEFRDLLAPTVGF